MSDAVLITLIISVVVLLTLLMFRRELSSKIGSSDSIEARAKGPGGLEWHLNFGSQTTPPLTENEKSKLQNTSKSWNKDKTGNIFWLSSDLSLAVPVAVNADPATVKHYVRQCFWHASQLELGETIEGRFEQLCNKISVFAVKDWNNIARRQEIQNELGALLHSIAFLMEGEDKDFLAAPPDDWRRC